MPNLVSPARLGGVEKAGWKVTLNGQDVTSTTLHFQAFHPKFGTLSFGQRPEGSQAIRSHGQDALRRQLETASRLLERGKEIQGLQDFHTQAGRMNQTGAELESSLEAMAKSKRPVRPEDLAKLDSALRRLNEQMADLRRAIEALPKPPPRSEAEASRRQYVVPLSGAERSADALQQAIAFGLGAVFVFAV